MGKGFGSEGSNRRKFLQKWRGIPHVAPEGGLGSAEAEPRLAPEQIEELCCAELISLLLSQKDIKYKAPLQD